MPDSIRQLLTNLSLLPAGRQVALALAAAGSLVFFAWIITGAAEPSYQGLYRGLEAEESARVVDALAQEKIPYQLEDGGTSILVPATQVQEARIRLAGRGLPSGGSVGFELFDKPSFGVTDFVQRVNYQRALQGELARTIEHLDPVERAHVQLAIPERKGVLADAEKHARASVIVRLQPGRELSKNQVDAIVHLVASSVENLDASEVAVVDGAGRLLAPREGDSNDLTSADGSTNYQGRVEGDLAKRIEDLLAKTVGPGGVIARVRAEMDWTESSVTEESFDPEAQVARSEQRTEELSTEGGGGDVSGVGGAPGVVANDPAAGASGGTPGSMSTRKVETINYEISKKVVQSNTPRGKIQKLSIAVLVADPAPPILEDGTPGPAPEPWTDEQLKQFEALARQAVGFDEKRGDLITITNAPFRAIDSMPIDAPSFVLNWLPLAESALRGMLALGALALFALLVVKPALGAIAAAPSAGRLPANAAEALARGLSSGSASELAKGGARAASPEPAVAIAPPAEGVKALRTWLAEG